MNSIHITANIFTVFLSLKIIVEYFLDQRNKHHILKHRPAVPANFVGRISLEDHQKAADYSIAKIEVANFFRVINTAILMLWTIGGGINFLNIFIARVNYSSIVSGLLMFSIFMLINFILGLPESIYQTFFLEEKFGFNKTTPKIFVLDIIKGSVLFAVLGLPILAGLIWIIDSLGVYWWAYGWGFLTLIQIALILIYPNFIAPLFNKFTPLEDGEVKETAENLLKKVGFTASGLFVMDGSKRSGHGNAYFTGFGKTKRIVFFDTLLNSLTAAEIEAVLAHELGHFKKHHIYQMMAKSFIMSLIGFYVLGVCLQSSYFFNIHGVMFQNSYNALLIFTLVSGVYTFFMTPISAYFSRKNEFEADAFAADVSSADELVSGLVKMYKDNASSLTPDPLYSSFYHSHPPAMIRIEHLNGLAKK